MYDSPINTPRHQPAAQPTLVAGDRRRLGQTNISLSLLGFGAAPVGNLYKPVSDEAACSAIRAALEQGLRYFDTAPYYGFGLSEQRLGKALACHPSEVVVSSKVGRLLQPAPHVDAGEVRHGFAEAPPMEPVYDYSYDGVMRSFEASCERLGGRRIDILLAHDIGAAKHGPRHQQVFREFMEGGYRAMHELRASGAVGAIGVGANEWEVCEQTLTSADVDCLLLAGRYTLLDQSACHSFLPLCARRSVSVLLGGPFNSGILATGVAAKEQQTGCYDYTAPPPAIIRRVQKLETLCAEFRVPLPAAALQFPAAHPQVASVVAGLADSSEVAQACEYFSLPIPKAFWQALRDSRLIHPDAPIPGGADHV